ncbi:hypothetical protein PI125_g22824 [Phytophthora idaei]|nr:hypothetical protein PI125_g22824 [Phytophthora idaei]
MGRSGQGSFPNCQMARIRSSAETKKSEVAQAAKDIDFPHLWRQLLSAGWQSKRPTGSLSNEWTYTSPSGESFVGTYMSLFIYRYRNEVYLSTSCSAVGEEPVVAYALSKEIVASNVSGDVSSKEEKSREETGTDSALDVSVTASQIDTSTALSQNTLEHLFGPESDLDSSLSREHVVGAFQRLLSGAESNMDSADGAESGVDGDTCDDAVAVPADDVNLLSTSDLSDDYGCVRSSGSEDSDAVEDDVVERREFQKKRCCWVRRQR